MYPPDRSLSPRSGGVGERVDGTLANSMGLLSVSVTVPLICAMIGMIKPHNRIEKRIFRVIIFFILYSDMTQVLFNRLQL